MPTSSKNRSANTRRKSRPRLTPEERAERLSAARQQLLDGIDALMTSEGWKQLITSRAWLRRCSFSNVLMILQQCPNATDVRPMSEWRSAGYPLMRKGTHKIKIWKPRFQTIEAESTDDSATAETPDKLQLSGFMLVPVVDISQLQGVPPENERVPPTPVELSGDAPTGLWDGVAAQIAKLGYRIERNDTSPAYGRTYYRERLVEVRPDVADSQAAKTLTHELAHILCEHESRGSTLPKEVREVEAESVACIVTAACGLNTLDYSVPYVAGWATDRETARKSAERVLAVADTILAGLEASGVTATPADTDHTAPGVRTAA